MNCLDLICRAMRRIGVIAGGELPRPDEQDDALQTLRALYRRLINDGAFGVVRDSYPTTETIEARVGQRIIASLGQVTLPDHAPDCAVICVVDPTTNQIDEYLFDGRTQKWTTIDDLTLTSPAPLSQRDSIGLSCALALELCDDYGQAPSELTIRNAARFQQALVHNWSVEPSAARGIYY